MRYIDKTKKKFLSYEGMIFILVIILMGFTVLPLTEGNDSLIIVQQADLQVVRDEFIAKDVLILAYRPETSHSQAVSDLQTVLPMFQKAQNGFQNGDVVLGLPNNPPVDVEQSLLDAQPRYAAMLAALKSILAHPDAPPDPIELNIILQNEQPYALSMYQVAVMELQHGQGTRNEQIIIRLIIEVIILLILIRPRAKVPVMMKDDCEEENTN